MENTHVYKGHSAFKTSCKICDKQMDDEIHTRNGGIICDNEDGPCTCGAWHRSSVSERDIMIAKFTISRWASGNEIREPDHKEMLENWLNTEFKDFILNKNGEQK